MEINRKDVGCWGLALGVAIPATKNLLGYMVNRGVEWMTSECGRVAMTAGELEAGEICIRREWEGAWERADNTLIHVGGIAFLVGVGLYALKNPKIEMSETGNRVLFWILAAAFYSNLLLLTAIASIELFGKAGD